MKTKQNGRVLGYSVREKNGKKTYVSHTYKHNGVTILKSKSFASEDLAKKFYEVGKKIRQRKIEELEAARLREEEGNSVASTEDNDSTSGEAGSIVPPEEPCQTCQLEDAAMLWVRYILHVSRTLMKNSGQQE